MPFNLSLLVSAKRSGVFWVWPPQRFKVNNVIMFIHCNNVATGSPLAVICPCFHTHQNMRFFKDIQSRIIVYCIYFYCILKDAVSIWLIATAAKQWKALELMDRLEACTLLKRHYVSLGSWSGLLENVCGKALEVVVGEFDACWATTWAGFLVVFVCSYFAGEEESFFSLCE